MPKTPEDLTTDTPTPRTAAAKQSAARVKVRITKFAIEKGHGVSTGERELLDIQKDVAILGDEIFAKAGDVIEVDPGTAKSLEDRGYAEIV